jgi:hypothetical protein
MNHLFRLFMAAGLVFLALILVLISVAQHNENLMAPLNFFLFLVLIAVYLLPAVLAAYRNCESTLWIILIDVFLGWTIFGWVVALGWANAGKVKEAPPTSHPPNHPLPTH